MSISGGSAAAGEHRGAPVFEEPAPLEARRLRRPVVERAARSAAAVRFDPQPLHRLAAGPGDPWAPEAPEPAEPAETPGRTPFEELLGVLGAALTHENVSRSVRSETWHRVAITPDVELSVRGELDLDKLALLQRIGDHLRHLLMKGTRK
jgi:hypothetical protein